jgi:hypothetical protein
MTTASILAVTLLRAAQPKAALDAAWNRDVQISSNSLPNFPVSTFSALGARVPWSAKTLAALWVTLLIGTALAFVGTARPKSAGRTALKMLNNQSLGIQVRKRTSAHPGPVNPARHSHWPVTWSQLVPLGLACAHRHGCAQFWPKKPLAHADKERTTFRGK